MFSVKWLLLTVDFASVHLSFLLVQFPYKKKHTSEFNSLVAVIIIWLYIYYSGQNGVYYKFQSRSRMLCFSS